MSAYGLDQQLTEAMLTHIRSVSSDTISSVFEVGSPLDGIKRASSLDKVPIITNTQSDFCEHPTTNTSSLIISNDSPFFSMAANTAFAFTRSAFNLAGSVFPATLIPAPFPPNHRPNKAELEACLSHAHVRAHNRRIRQTLGLGIPSSVAQRRRTFRATGLSIPRESPDTTTTTDFFKHSPVSAQDSPVSDITNTILEESQTILSKSPVIPSRPTFPHRRSRLTPFRGVGLGIQLEILDDDAVLTPSHIFPDTLRRTPGAPPIVETKKTSEPGSSYFHLPSNLLTPVLTPVLTPASPATIGLGIVNIDLGEQSSVEHYFPSDF